MAYLRTNYPVLQVRVLFQIFKKTGFPMTLTSKIHAMNQGATIDLFTENVFNFPTIAEAYRVAAWNGIGQLEDVELQASV